jgi:hypothetical protein
MKEAANENKLLSPKPSCNQTNVIVIIIYYLLNYTSIHKLHRIFHKYQCFRVIKMIEKQNTLSVNSFVRENGEVDLSMRNKVIRFTNFL